MNSQEMHEACLPIVTQVSKNLARKFPGLEHDELVQEAWKWVFQNKRRIPGMLAEPQKFIAALAQDVRHEAMKQSSTIAKSLYTDKEMGVLLWSLNAKRRARARENWDQVLDHVETCLERLSEEDQEVLRYRFVEARESSGRQDFDAIGKALNLSPNTVAKRCTRAMRRLQFEFTKESS